MRWSSPACINCKRVSFKLTNNTIFAEYQGISSQSPTKYRLNITLEKDISSEHSTWKEDSVGGVSLSLIKN